jgi:putative transposase
VTLPNEYQEQNNRFGKKIMSKQFRDRKKIRLKDYDYTKPGYYFVTINTNRNIQNVSKIINGKIEFNKLGKIIDMVLKDLPKHYPNCELDEYIIMPNHVHGIIRIINSSREGFITLPVTNVKTSKTNHGLPEIIRGFKTFSSKTINERIKPVPKFRWQKSYYDRIIWNERELDNVRRYIKNNPLSWEKDRNNTGEVEL